MSFKKTGGDPVIDPANDIDDDDDEIIPSTPGQDEDDVSILSNYNGNPIPIIPNPSNY